MAGETGARLGLLGRSAVYGGAALGAEYLMPGTGGTVAGTAAAVEGLNAVIKLLHKSVQKLAAPFEEFGTSAEKAAGAFGAKGWFEGFVDAATKVDDLRANLQRATGQTDKYAKAALNLQGALTGLGLSTAEAQKTFEALHEGYSDFSELSPKVQKDLATQAASLTRLGVSAEDTAKNYQIMGKAMRMTNDDMVVAQKKLSAAALAIGVSPAKIAKDYAAIMPNLLRWGKSAEKIFYDLAAQAKATGVEMGELISVAGGFDEFDSAAEKVANLNMLLGGPFLNTSQMMIANESERINLLRQGIALTGQSVEALGRHRGPAVAMAAGFKDMASFYAAMGAPQSVIDKFTAKLTPAQLAQQNLNKAIAKGVKLSEVWSAWFENVSRILGAPFLSVMKTFASFMKSGEGGKAITTILGQIAKIVTELMGKWDSLGEKSKARITSWAMMALKMTAVSYATKEMMGVFNPLLTLITSPGSGLIWAMIMLIEYWGKWDLLLKDSETFLRSLDAQIRVFLSTNKEEWKILGYVEEFYVWLHDKIPLAMVEIKKYFGPGGSFGSDMENVVKWLKEGHKWLSEFFRAANDPTHGTGLTGFLNGLRAGLPKLFDDVGKLVKRLVTTVFGDIMGGMADKEFMANPMTGNTMFTFGDAFPFLKWGPEAKRLQGIQTVMKNEGWSDDVIGATGGVSDWQSQMAAAFEQDPYGANTKFQTDITGTPMGRILEANRKQYNLGVASGAGWFANLINAGQKNQVEWFTELSLNQMLGWGNENNDWNWKKGDLSAPQTYHDINKPTAFSRGERPTILKDDEIYLPQKEGGGGVALRPGMLGSQNQQAVGFYVDGKRLGELIVGPYGSNSIMDMLNQELAIKALS